MELTSWGGFYVGSDGYYIVEGAMNEAQDREAEVIRVIKYDFNWNRMNAATIPSNMNIWGGDVRYPFQLGCVEMTEVNGMLYIVTGHEGYVDSRYGQGHQGFLMIGVDMSTMTGEIIKGDLGHSFAQYIEAKDSDLYVLELSEGARYTKLSKYNTLGSLEKSISVFPYGGNRLDAWAIPCYATVDGMAISSDHILGLGTSIDQSK